MSNKSLHSQFDKQLSILWKSVYEAGKVKGCQKGLLSMKKSNKVVNEKVNTLYKSSMANLTEVTKTFNKMIDPRDLAIIKLRLKLNPSGPKNLKDSEIAENENFSRVISEVVTSFYMEGVTHGETELRKKFKLPYEHLEKESQKLLKERKMNLTVFSNTFYGLLQSRDIIIEKLQIYIKNHKICKKDRNIK